MWTRAALKDRAKLALTGNYWKAFIVALVLLLVGGINLSGPFDGSGNGGSNSHSNNGGSNSTELYTNTNDYPNSNLDFNIKPNFSFVEIDSTGFHLKDLPNLTDPSSIGAFFGFFVVGFVLFAIIISIVWRVFLGYPVEIGCSSYFLNLREKRHEYRDMVQFFNREQYWNIVKVMFMRALFNFFWYLLLIIPGIVKAYAYSMVPYILAEEPELDYDTAIQKSMAMTDGHKFDMFVLDLSFLGWYLLGLLLCCVGGVFVNPYYLATKAELYVVLSGKSELPTADAY